MPPNAVAITPAAASKRLTLIATILGSSLAYMVGSVVNVALPAIQASFGADAAGVQWVINAYLLPLGALVLIGGALGDHYGRKRLFIIGLVIFTAASFAAALAPTLGFLLAARAGQGLGAALLAPNSLAILAAAFTGAARSKAVGAWASAGALGAAAAPVLGGWLVDSASWRWALLLTVPPAIAALIVGCKGIHESRAGQHEAASLDWQGAVLATGALAAIVWALIAFPARGLGDAAVLTAFAVGVSGAIAFILVERAKGDAAMAPLALFATAQFTGISLLTLFLYGALAAMTFLLPYVLITAFGFSATEAGFALLPFPVTLGLLSRKMGGVANRFGVRRVLTVGPMVVATGFALMARISLDGFSYWADVFPGLMAIAIGMTISVAPLTTAVMDSVSDDRVGVASGINSAIARGAGLLSTAFLGLVLVNAAVSPEALVESFGNAAMIGAVLAALSAITAATLLRQPRGRD